MINPAMGARHALEARDQTRGKSVKVLVSGGAAAVLFAGAVVLVDAVVVSGLVAGAVHLAGNAHPRWHNVDLKVARKLL